ncbi:MAG: tetratricopeptide repeat protein [Calditrichia bacterium]
MTEYEVTLLALNIRRWDLEANRISFTTYYVLDDEERSFLFDLAITQPPDMVEEFLGKLRMGAIKQAASNGLQDAKILFANESFLRQKLYNYFKRILAELNNPRRKKGQSKMIFTTHMDIFNENQDIAFLPQIIQFYVVLNWARKYYEKDDFQRSVEPLRKLVKIKPDFGLGYKWLARSYKKIRKYDEAMYFYQKYAEVDDSLDAWLDLAQSYRKGKLYDKSLKIYQDILEKNPDEKEALIGMAQILYAQNDSGYLEKLDRLYREYPDWMKQWLQEEFNFRIYISPKTPLAPVTASHYLGFEKVFDLTQKAFQNDVPSHFNPKRARMSFYKEEIDTWAEVMNRYNATEEEVKLYPENIDVDSLELVEVNLEEDDQDVQEEPKEKSQPDQPQKRSAKLEDIINRIRASRRMNGGNNTENDNGNQEQPQKRRRGRPPKKKSPQELAKANKPKRPRGRPPRKKTAEELESEANKPKRPRGRPPKDNK